MYELRFEKASEQGTLMRASNVGDTEMVPEREEGKTSNRHYALQSHAWTLSALYHIEPSFPDSWCYGGYKDILALADTVNFYGCMPAVKPFLELHLLRHQQAIALLCSFNDTRNTQLLMGYKCEID